MVQGLNAAGKRPKPRTDGFAVGKVKRRGGDTPRWHHAAAPCTPTAQAPRGGKDSKLQALPTRVLSLLLIPAPNPQPKKYGWRGAARPARCCRRGDRGLGMERGEENAQPGEDFLLLPQPSCSLPPRTKHQPTTQLFFMPGLTPRAAGDGTGDDSRRAT